MSSPKPLPTANQRKIARETEALGRSRGIVLRGVAFLAPSYAEAGAAGSQSRSLARGLANLGVPISFLSPEPCRLPERETLGLIEHYRVPTGLFRAGEAGELSPVALGLSELAALTVLKIAAHRLNLIFAEGAALGAAAARVGKALGLPSVVRIASCGPWGEIQSIGRDPQRDALLAGLRAARRVVVPSEAVASEARSLLGLPPERIDLIPDGVELGHFKPRPWREDLPSRLLYLGPLHEEARLDVLLRAFAQLREERDLPDLELVVAGAGPRREAYGELGRTLGLGSSLRFVELGSDLDYQDLLRDARAFVQPGPLTPGHALLEALATGLPAVAARLPGVDEVVDHDRSGLLVPPDDAEALAAALGRVLGEAELRKRLGEGARAAAEERFDHERSADLHVDLFEQLAVIRDERPTQPPRLLSLRRDGPVALAAARAGLRTTGAALSGLLRRK